MSKYLDIQYMFGREYVKNGIVTVNWVSTAMQRADLMTKILTGHATRSHCQSLGLLKGRIKGEVGKSEDRVMFCVRRDGEGKVFKVKEKLVWDQVNYSLDPGILLDETFI